VLSQTDLSVIALTYQYEVAVNGKKQIRTVPGQRIPPQQTEDADATAQAKEEEEDEASSLGSGSVDEQDEPDEAGRSIEQVLHDPADPDAAVETEDSAFHVTAPSSRAPVPSSSRTEEDVVVDLPADEDGEGDWITPSNVSSHRNHDLGLVTADGTWTAPPATIAAACMTGDFAVQNVLMGIGLGLVGEGGKRISKVRSWVLRCHSCFK